MRVNERTQAALRRFLDSKDKDAINDYIQLVNEDYSEQDRQRLVEIVALARPSLREKLPELINGRYRARPFTFYRRWQIAVTASVYTADWTLSAKRLPFMDSSESQAPAGRVDVFQKLTCFIGSTTDQDTIEEIQQKLGVQINYPDGRKAFPLGVDELLASRLSSPPAGAIAGPAVVESTRTEIIRWGGGKVLGPKDFIVVAPGDHKDNCGLQGRWLPDFAASPPTTPAGGAADVYLHVVAEGERWEPIDVAQ